MSQTCERCYMVVQRACQSATEAAECPKLARRNEMQLPKTIQRPGPLTRLREANQRALGLDSDQQAIEALRAEYEAASTTELGKWVVMLHANQPMNFELDEATGVWGDGRVCAMAQATRFRTHRIAQRVAAGLVDGAGDHQAKAMMVKHAYCAVLYALGDRRV